MNQPLLLATRNSAKVAELRRILTAAGLTGLRVVGEDAVSELPEVVESGATFAENALLKARSAAAHTGWAALADDSGLCVDALAGMPGVLSARWCGHHGDDRANLELVLNQVADVPAGRRGARFVCVAAFVTPDGREVLTEGEVLGRLLTEPRGTGGFGYDPIFVPDGWEVTTAELAPEVKDSLSHRGRAFTAVAPHVRAWLDSEAGRGQGGD